MSRFRGHHIHTIDSKGRLSIPSKFREILKTHYDERLMVTFMDGCLTAYPHDEWIKLEDQILKLPQHDKKVKELMRTYISTVEECCVDNQGRILISPVLRELAGLKDKVRLLGCLNRIEIWDYEASQEEVEKKIRDNAHTSQILSEKFNF